MTPSNDTPFDQRNRPLRGREVDAYLRDPAIKQHLVTPMFDLVAPRYDEFTRRFSFGMDAGWKRTVVELAVASAPTGGSCLDLACGTGDLALAVAHRRRDVRVVGVDASRSMIAHAERRRAGLELPNVTFCGGDLSALAVPDASADVVTAGYALRNAPAWQRALDEIARVLRRGGHLVTLDFYRPERSAWRRAFLWYLAVAGAVYGWLWHREPMAYGYIARSIEHFVSGQEFARGLRSAGFEVQRAEHRLGGAIAIHHARKVRSEVREPAPSAARGQRSE